MIQHRAVYYVLNQPWRRNVRDSINSLLLSLEWSTLQLCRESARLILLYKIIIYYEFQLTIFQFHHQLLPPDQEMT